MRPDSLTLAWVGRLDGYSWLSFKELDAHRRDFERYLEKETRPKLLETTYSVLIPQEVASS